MEQLFSIDLGVLHAKTAVSQVSARHSNTRVPHNPIGNGDKVCVGGGAGFIGSHIAKRLKEAGYKVTVVDWKENEFMEKDEFCDEFILDDLRKLEVACRACKDCVQVYNLAADMGGMGFIVSNESVLSFNNTAISMNMLEAARRNKCRDFFYSSSACVYNEAKQEDPENPGLVEADAWPARPQDMYGLEKLYAEEMALAYGHDFPMHICIARFHNIYGPRGTWKGGREKAPAAFCRKAITSEKEFEIWGDGKQTRSFTYIDVSNTRLIELANILQSPACSISRLELCGSFGDEGVEFLAEALKTNRTVTTQLTTSK